MSLRKLVLTRVEQRSENGRVAGKQIALWMQLKAHLDVHHALHVAGPAALVAGFGN